MRVHTMGAMRRSKLAVVATAVALALAACGSGDGGGGEAPAGGGDATGFYAGKTIELIVPLAAGGAGDTEQRLIAQHLSRFLEGNPTIVVLNEDNGGNSVIAANDYVREGSHGGLRLLGMGGSNMGLLAFGNSQVEYTNPTETMTPLMATSGGGVMVARTDAGLKSGADLANHQGELFLGARRPDGSFMKRMLGFDILGAKVTELLGYEGASEINTAFLQGETNINGTSTPSYFTNNVPEIEAGNQVLLFNEGYLDENGQIGPDPALPDTPTIADVYEQIHGAPPSGEAWDAYGVLAASNGGIERTVWIHNDAPPEAIAELKTATEAMIKDPEFLEAAQKNLGGYPIMNGEQTAAYVEKNIVNPNEQGLAYVKKLAMDRYGIDLAEE